MDALFTIALILSSIVPLGLAFTVLATGNDEASWQATKLVRRFLWAAWFVAMCATVCLWVYGNSANMLFPYWAVFVVIIGSVTAIFSGYALDCSGRRTWVEEDV